MGPSVSDIVIGLRGFKEMVVQRHQLASVLGNIGVPVLSTHNVVLLMELAARNAVEGRLPEGMMTVGAMINLRHLAATPLGAKVRAEGCLRKIEGRRLLFDVVAYDEVEKIAEGENEQIIVSAERFVKAVIRKQVNVRMVKDEKS